MDYLAPCPMPGRPLHHQISTPPHEPVARATSRNLDVATVTPGPDSVSTPRKPRQRYGFGPAAPSQDIPFPAHANMTAAELLAFLPHSIRVAGVIYRLVSNGGTRRLFAVMVNTQRSLLVQWSNNSCGTAIYKAMNDAGFKGWTVKIHDTWHNATKATWDEANLDVSRCRTTGEISGQQPETLNILFRDLAKDVKQMPRGFDALDLTRMVLYCIRNLEQPWMYPRDYATLLTLLGGPAKILPQHLDREVFERWRSIDLPPANSVLKSQDIQKKKGARFDALRDDSLLAEIQPIMRKPSPPCQSKMVLKKQHTVNGQPREGTVKHTVPGGEVTRYETSTNIRAYVRPVANYVAPPNSTLEPSHRVFEIAFKSEGMIDEGDAFSPYAFGGPRSAAPYRALYHIDLPHREDTSGWAENMRWASEQRFYFSRHGRTQEWTECPEHMELIATTRKERIWVSDELMERILEDQHREEQDERSSCSDG